MRVHNNVCIYIYVTWHLRCYSIDKTTMTMMTTTTVSVVNCYVAPGRPPNTRETDYIVVMCSSIEIRKYFYSVSFTQSVCSSETDQTKTQNELYVHNNRFFRRNRFVDYVVVTIRFCSVRYDIITKHGFFFFVIFFFTHNKSPSRR